MHLSYLLFLAAPYVYQSVNILRRNFKHLFIDPMINKIDRCNVEVISKQHTNLHIVVLTSQTVYNMVVN